MNAVERAAFTQSVALHDEMTTAVGERTLAILDHRRRTAIVRRRGWLVRRLLAAADAAGLLLAFVLAQALFGTTSRVDALEHREEFLLFAATVPLWIVVAKLYRLYDFDEERTDHSTSDDVVGVFHMVTVGAWLLLALSWLTGLTDPGIAKVVAFWALAVVLVTTARAGARALARRRPAYLQNAVIVGAGAVGQLVAHKLLQHPEYGINLVGFLDASPLTPRSDVAEVPLLGAPDRLPAVIRLFDVERVIVAFSEETHAETIDLIRSVNDLDVQVDIVPRLFEVITPGVGVHTVEGLPLVGLPPLRLSRSSRLLKRTMDVVLASVALVALAPLLAVIAACIKAGSPGPVFFRQVRMGGRERPFRIFKFRTMVVDADDAKHLVAHLNMHAQNGGDPRMFKVPDDPRVTRVGRVLRRYSLDELPQLLNVLRGEMTLVGPRPLILDEDRHVRKWARRRLDLKPGVTGLWQVLGASDIPFEEMTRLDYLYVTTWSLSGDLRLILRTLPALMRARAAY